MSDLAIPRISTTPILSTYRAAFGGLIDEIKRWSAQIDGIGVVKLGSSDVVIVCSPALVHEVLVEKAASFNKGPALKIYLRQFLGDGLLTSEGADHRQRRKMIAPALMPKRIATFADVMVEHSERAQERWKSGDVVNISKEMMRLTLGIVGRTLFDADVLHEAEELGEVLSVALHHTSRMARAPIKIPMSWKTPGNVRTLKAMERVDRTIYRMIRERRESGCYKDDLLSMLLQASDEDDGSKMDDRQVRDEAITMFLAGHETTANALTWAWYLLVKNPETYAKLQAEATTALGGRSAGVDDLPKLPYALQAFKETLRLYPPAYMYGRTTMEDVSIGGYPLRKGAVVLLSPYMIQHRPDLFPDPYRFDPDRFLPEAEKALPRYAFMPFGGGSRICIGNHFALMEGQLILATLAQRVTFAMAPGRETVEPEPLLTLRPKHGPFMTVARPN